MNETGHDAIDAWFQFTPPRPLLSSGSTTTKKKGIRPASQFETHMERQLVLNKVEYLPNMTSSLATIASDAVVAHPLYPALPPPTSTFSTGEFFDLSNSVADTEVQGQSCVTRLFDKVSGAILRAAATLEFGLPVWSDDCLSFKTSSQGQRAIADGFLRLREGKADTPDKRALYETFCDLLLWEFKSTITADKELIYAIMELSQEAVFPWKYCEMEQWECAVLHGPDCGIVPVFGARMGPDAATPPVNYDQQWCGNWVSPAGVKTSQAVRNKACLLLQKVQTLPGVVKTSVGGLRAA